MKPRRIRDVDETMRVHRVTVVTTANTGDYTDLPEIHPLTPAEAF